MKIHVALVLFYIFTEDGNLLEKFIALAERWTGEDRSTPE
jgi:hypothetical protein